MDAEADMKTYGNPSLAAGTLERPLVTFALFAYNQEKYIREAVEGAFSQTYQPLEIILSDDCSMDRTFEIMNEMAAEYRGPHLVRVRRSSSNLRLANHINCVAREAQGEVVVVAAGDDVSEPSRTEALVAVFIRSPDTYAAFSNYKTIPGGATDERCGIKNEFITLTEALMNGGGVHVGAAYAYRRLCFFWPAPLPDWVQLEDRILPFRAALLGAVRYTGKPLVRYRLAASSHESEAKMRRIRGYNYRQHWKYLLELISIARSEGRITTSKALYAAGLIKGVRFATGQEKNLGTTSLAYLPLRLLRKSAVIWAAVREARK